MQDYVIVLPSASRTTTQTTTLQLGGPVVGLVAVLNMTVVGTGSVTLSINGYDQVSGATWLILGGAAVITNSTNVYTIYPGLVAAPNLVVNNVVPMELQFVVTANNANAAVYSLSVNPL